MYIYLNLEQVFRFFWEFIQVKPCTSLRLQVCLTHSIALVPFYIPCKHQETSCFQMFSGGI